jgi:hypothetical protein
METRLVNKSRGSVFTIGSKNEKYMSGGTTKVLDSILKVDGWEKAAQAFELECDKN